MRRGQQESRFVSSARDGAPSDRQPPVATAAVTEDSNFGQPRTSTHGRPPSAPTLPEQSRDFGGQRCVTPRQTCPQPDGFGRNLRSKTRWFTGFCNSHQVSHFATFFIDARAEISVAESRFRLKLSTTQSPRQNTVPGAATSARFVVFP